MINLRVLHLIGIIEQATHFLTFLVLRLFFNIILTTRVNHKHRPKQHKVKTNFLYNMDSHFCNSHSKIMTKIQKLTMQLFSFTKGVTFHHLWVTRISAY
jgi:hypothetical protein